MSRDNLRAPLVMYVGLDQAASTGRMTKMSNNNNNNNMMSL
jgi:hypothetical protein